MGSDDPLRLPDGLPEPEDDGAARHLSGSVVPDIALPSTGGGATSLAQGGAALVVGFPWAGRPGEPLPAEGWDRIPGARGCTTEVCGFRDHHEALGALTVLGLSAQSTERQREIVERLELPFPLLSDEDLRLAAAMRLPTFVAGGRTLLRRITLLIRDGRVERVWYPVFPPDRHAEQVVAELRA
jgi:peroxiredoxin